MEENLAGILDKGLPGGSGTDAPGSSDKKSGAQFRFIKLEELA